MYSSRQFRREERQNMRKAALLIAGTIGILVLAAVVGIPVLTRTALFMSSLNSKNSVSGKTDTIPPVAPQIVISYDATNSATQNISGFAESGSTVYLTQNSRDAGNVVADSGGIFQFPGINLTKGDNLFIAVAVDEAGNKSLTSSQVHLAYSNQAPKLDITSPTDHQSVNDKSFVEIKGTTENTSRLTVNDRTIILNSTGGFSTNYPLNDGDNVLIFLAFDSAGNQTRKELTVGHNP